MSPRSARSSARMAHRSKPSAGSATGWSRRPALRSLSRTADMLRGLTARVVLSFLAVALVVWVVIGAALFVILRQAHTDGTGSRLEDLATSLVGQTRTALAVGDNASALSVLRDQLTGDIEAFLVLNDGRIV